MECIPVMHGNKGARTKLYLACIALPFVMLLAGVDLADTKKKRWHVCPRPYFDTKSCMYLQTGMQGAANDFWMEKCSLDKYKDVFVWKVYYKYFAQHLELFEYMLKLLDTFGGLANVGIAKNDFFDKILCSAVYIPCDSKCTVVVPEDELVAVEAEGFCDRANDLLSKDLSFELLSSESKSILLTVLQIPCDGISKTIKNTIGVLPKVKKENSFERYMQTYDSARDPSGGHAPTYALQVARIKHSKDILERTDAVIAWKRQYLVGLSFAYGTLFISAIALAQTPSPQSKSKVHS